MSSVQVKVAEQLSAISPKVEDKVVDALVSRELTKRSDALVQVMDLLAKAEKDHRKLGPDQKTFDEKGTVTGESFSQGRTTERKKSQQRIDKLTGALTMALEKGEYNNVY